MNDLRLDEVHTTFLDQWLVSLAMLQEGLTRELCFNSVFAQVTDPQARFCHVYHMELISFQTISNYQTRFVAFGNLGLFFHPRFGVGLIRTIAEERILQPPIRLRDFRNHLGSSLHL